MSHAGNGRAPQRAASLVWGLLFVVIAILTVLTSNHLIGQESIRLGLPLALIGIGLLGLIVSGLGTRSRIKDKGRAVAQPTIDTTREPQEQGENPDGRQETQSKP